MGIFDLVGNVVGLGVDVIKVVDEVVIEPVTDVATDVVKAVREEIK